MRNMHKIVVEYFGEEVPLFVGCEDQAVQLTIAIQNCGYQALYVGFHPATKRTPEQDQIVARLIDEAFNDHNSFV